MDSEDWLKHLLKPQLLALSERVSASDDWEGAPTSSWSKGEVVDWLAEFESNGLVERMIGTELNRVLKKLDVPYSGTVAQKRARLLAVLAEAEDLVDDEDDTEQCEELLAKLTKEALLELADELRDPDIKSGWRKKRIFRELTEYYTYANLHAAMEVCFGAPTSDDDEDSGDEDSGDEDWGDEDWAEDDDDWAEDDDRADEDVPQANGTGGSGATFGALGPARCLVIGVANYRDAPLENTIRDAHAIADTLKAMGHLVQEVLEDPTRKQISLAVRRLQRSLRPREGAIVYFSGHGVVDDDGRNFVVPCGVDDDDEVVFDDDLYAADGFLKKLKSAAYRVLVLDACRTKAGLARGRGASHGGGLRAMAANADVNNLIWFATAPGTTASDGEPGGYGVFTEALLKHLNTPGAAFEEIDRAVRKAVVKATRGEQIPWSNTSFIDRWCPAGGS